MLTIYRKGIAAGVLAAAVFASGALQAQDTSIQPMTSYQINGFHTIMIVDGGYFPALTFVQPGEKVRFENQSATQHVVTGDGDAWTSGPIADMGTYTIEVKEDTPLVFSGIAADGMRVMGEFSFEETLASN